MLESYDYRAESEVASELERETGRCNKVKGYTPQGQGQQVMVYDLLMMMEQSLDEPSGMGFCEWDYFTWKHT